MWSDVGACEMWAMSAAARLKAPEPVADTALLARVRDGELSALGQLYDRHAPAVRCVLTRLGVQPGDVDDLVQATFLDVVRAAGSYDGRDSARPWLVGIAVMRSRRHRRALSRWAAKLLAWTREPGPLSGEAPDGAVERSQTARRAQAALDGLSAKKREVFVLVVLEGLAGDEVAQTLGIPVATVWTRLHYARLELRAALSREDR